MNNLNIDLQLIQPKSLGGPHMDAWFTLKNSGHNPEGSRIRGLNLGYNTADSKEVVTQNRSALLSALNIDEDWIAYADQVHSNRIQIVSQGGTYSSTDGLITRIPGLTLAIQVADCAAVLLWDSSANVIAALHAGWRGAVSDIVPKGVRMMVEQGARAEDIHAFVSPCLSLKSFEVGAEVAEQFPEQQVDYTSFEKPHVDLKGFLKHQLLEQGVSDKHVEVHPGCTLQEAEKYYSYRREGNQSGRMMALIQIKNSPI